MKNLSDYKGDEAIELWGDMIESISRLIADPKVQDIYKSGMPKVFIAKEILKEHPKEVEAILLRIDPEPINGLTVVSRFVGILKDIGSLPELQNFFGSAGQEDEKI